MRNFDLFNDTLTITSIVDVIQSGSGPVISPNLLAAATNLLLFQFVDRSFNYVVQPNDPEVVTDEVRVGGTDQHDGTPGEVPQDFFLTFQAQFRVIRPRLCVTKDCVNGVGENGPVSFTGNIRNCGNTVLTNVMVSNIVNGVTLYVLGPITLDIGQSAPVSGSYVPVNPCAATDTLIAWGTDELGFTTNHSATATCSNLLNPRLVVTSACPPAPTQAGGTMTITGTVTNTGSATLNNVNVTNFVPALGRAVRLAGPLTLAPGAGTTFSDSFPVGDNCPGLEHTVTASGRDRCQALASHSSTGICPVEGCNPMTNLCVIRAISDPFFNPDGSEHAAWLPGISTNLIFWPDPGSWAVNPDGTAHLTGTLRSITNINACFVVDVTFSGAQTTPPAGSPKKDLDPIVYSDRGGPVDTASWVYYTSFNGTLTGCGIYQGAILNLTRTGPAFQVGIGASGKNVNYGASGWFNWTVVQPPLVGSLPGTGLGDFNVDIVVCEPPDTLCILRATSDPIYHPNGSSHALWLPGISTNLIFSPEPGTFVENIDGTARLKGLARSITNMSSGFAVDLLLAGYTTTPPSGSPKKDLDDKAYVNKGGPVDANTWRYYTQFSGTLQGFGLYADSHLTIKRTGPAFQIGFGANNKNINYGASGWFTWKVVKQPNTINFPVNGQGDFNIDLVVCEPGAIGDLVWDDSSNPNGVRDAGEPGVPNIEVRLTDSAAIVLAVTSTDANGHYQFANLTPGTYKIKVVAPTGSIFTGQNIGNDSFDSDVNANGFTAALPLGMGVVNNTVDAGFSVLSAPTPVVSPRLIAYQSLPAGDVRLTISGPIGRNYLIEGSDDLATWRFITIIPNSNGNLEFNDLDRGTRCFYRVRLMQ